MLLGTIIVRLRSFGNSFVDWLWFEDGVLSSWPKPSFMITYM